MTNFLENFIEIIIQRSQLNKMKGIKFKTQFQLEYLKSFHFHFYE